MSLIRKPAQLEVPQIVKAMIYGQAGMGKTTLALSAPKPLLLDFDNGVHRVNFKHQVDTYQAKDWKEALQVLNEDLSKYETIVVDTIGKMMDFIINHVTRGGIPQIRDWSRINQEFASFTRTISMMNKNVIFVAHRDIRKEGDDNVFVPALREKSYTAIVTELDLLGYIEAKGSERTITFDPTSRNDGKNTCNLPGLMKIPTVVDAKGDGLENIFFTKQIIAPYVSNLQKRADEMKKYNELIEEIKEQIALLTDEQDANDFVSRIGNFERIGNSVEVARKLFAAKVKQLGLAFNQKEQKYEKAAA